MIDDYGKLTLNEVRHLAKEGDVKAKQYLDEIWAEFRAAIDTAPAGSIGAFHNDITKFINRDQEAAKTLSKYWYTQGKIFDPRRLEVLRDYVNQRRDDDKGREVWWDEEIVIQNLTLVLLSPEINDFPLTDVYKVARNKLRQEIEKDLTGGYTLDGNEFQNINPLDKSESETDELDENGLYDLFDNVINLNLLSLEDSIDLRKELGKLTPHEYMIIMQSSYGDSLELSEQLKKSAITIRTIRSRVLKKLKMRLNSL